jgi:two-component sensor histidine kinase
MWGCRPKLGSDQWCGSWRLFRPDGTRLPHDQCPMAIALKDNRPINGMEAAAERPDGTRVPFMAFPSPLRDASGRAVGAVNMLVDITERKLSEERITLLAREVDHRSRNLLALVQATVHLTQGDTPGELKTAIEGRLQALANAHALLAQSRWAGADLRYLVAEELSPFCHEGGMRARISGPSLALEPETAQSIAIAVHELTTNAVKYGALSAPTGHVQVEWSRLVEGRFALVWTETGGPSVEPPTRQGFGTRVIERMIRNQLKGEVHFDWRREGLVCEIALPELNSAGAAADDDNGPDRRIGR